MKTSNKAILLLLGLLLAITLYFTWALGKAWASRDPNKAAAYEAEIHVILKAHETGYSPKTKNASGEAIKTKP